MRNETCPVVLRLKQKKKEKKKRTKTDSDQLNVDGKGYYISN